MKFNQVTLIASLVFTATLFAGEENIPTLSQADSSINIAQVQASFTLKKPEGANQTRINLVVKDLGGSTDVSPMLGLYLIFWKDGEMGDATAAFNIDDGLSLVDYESKPNGVLVLKIKQYNDGGFDTITKTIDYSKFAAKFERDAASAQGEFALTWVKGSIPASVVHNYSRNF